MCAANLQPARGEVSVATKRRDGEVAGLGGLFGVAVSLDRVFVATHVETRSSLAAKYIVQCNHLIGHDDTSIDKSPFLWGKSSSV